MFSPRNAKKDYVIVLEAKNIINNYNQDEVSGGSFRGHLFHKKHTRESTAKAAVGWVEDKLV